EAGRRDRRAARLAAAVLPGPQALQRLGEAVGPLDEESAHRERHLAVLADPPRVAGGLALALVLPGPGIVLEGNRAAQPLQAVDGVPELLLQCPSDVVHGSALLRPNRVFGCGRTPNGSAGGPTGVRSRGMAW